LDSKLSGESSGFSEVDMACKLACNIPQKIDLVEEFCILILIHGILRTDLRHGLKNCLWIILSYNT